MEVVMAWKKRPQPPKVPKQEKKPPSTPHPPKPSLVEREIETLQWLKDMGGSIDASSTRYIRYMPGLAEKGLVKRTTGRTYELTKRGEEVI